MVEPALGPFGNVDVRRNSRPKGHATLRDMEVDSLAEPVAERLHQRVAPRAVDSPDSSDVPHEFAILEEFGDCAFVCQIALQVRHLPQAAHAVQYGFRRHHVAYAQT